MGERGGDYNLKIDSRSGRIEEKLNVFHLRNAPAFFIHFPHNYNRFDGIKIYDTLLQHGLPSFWRSFGINGFFNPDNLPILEQIGRESGLPIYFGLPYRDSFIIKGESDGKPPIYDLGCSAVVASYKLAAFPQFSNHFASILSENDSSEIRDPKGCPLWINSIESTTLPPITLPVPQTFGLSSIGECEEVTFDGIGKREPVLLKLDVNGSTATKTNLGWLEGELKFTEFFLYILSRIDNQFIVIDPIGESIQLVCQDATLVPQIHRGIRESLNLFPDISISLVGIKMPKISVFTAGRLGLFTDPPIDENIWYRLESDHKKKVRCGSLRTTSFVIQKNDH